MSIRVGVVGLGFMGRTHLSIYAKNKRVQVAGVADFGGKRPTAEVTGNVGDAKLGLDLNTLRVFDSPEELIASPEIDVVDLCVPTFAHAEYAVRALKAGKHVLCEKPLTIDLREAERIARAAAQAKSVFMPAHCMRFWPEWVWLKDAVDSKRYGSVQSAVFRRFASTPKWTSNNWILQPKLSGSALYDLHIHDTDFVRYLFGDPKAVYSVGNGGKATKDGIDHVVTHYRYPRKNLLVVAEGGWNADPTFGFVMRFTVVFEHATADFDIGRTGQTLLLHKSDATEPETVKTSAASGWEEEIGYFLECVASGRKPTVTNAADARKSLLLIKAEEQSARTGKIVPLRKR